MTPRNKHTFLPPLQHRKAGCKGSSNYPPGTTRSRILATVVGPIPRTRRRSSGERNGPSLSRLSRILCAKAGPIPGSACNSSGSARFRSTRGTGSARGLVGREDMLTPDPSLSVRILTPRKPRPGVSNGTGLEKSRWGRIFANVAGPIPLTRKRSSGRANPPLSSRSATKARAVDGPMPGSRSNSSSPLRFGSSVSSGAKGADLRARSSRASRLPSNRCGSSVPPSGRTTSWTRTWSIPILRTDRATRRIPPLRRLRPSIGVMPERWARGWARAWPKGPYFVGPSPFSAPVLMHSETSGGSRARGRSEGAGVEKELAEKAKLELGGSVVLPHERTTVGVAEVEAHL